MAVEWELKMDHYRAAARRRQAFAEQERRHRLSQGWAVAKRAADLLRESFAVHRVMVFGSLVHPDLFHQRSDVDIAVWGLGKEEYLRAVAAVTALDREITVDLISVEEAQESLRTIIAGEGTPL